MDKKLICVSGLPRSGSTLLCQLLGQHPDIYSIGHSSPLCGAVNNIRHHISDSDFLLSQLDCDFELGYQRLKNAYTGFISGWFNETDRPAVVDKNRGWLRAVEMVHDLVPDYRILVCIRNPLQIFGSIEARHDKTRLLDFPDHIDAHGAYSRAERLFGNNGIIGSPMNDIGDVSDILKQQIHERIYYVPFEPLINQPVDSMNTLFDWIELAPHAINPDQLTVQPHESDSYYRFKYSHATRSSIGVPPPHPISPRIARWIVNKNNWFFERYYPEVLTGFSQQKNQKSRPSTPKKKNKKK